MLRMVMSMAPAPLTPPTAQVQKDGCAEGWMCRRMDVGMCGRMAVRREGCADARKDGCAKGIDKQITITKTKLDS